MTLRPGITLRREKGQPEGSAVTGKTRKFWGANPDLVSGNAAGQNNSNLTPIAASVANGGWELILGIVPIIVLYTCPVSNFSGSLRSIVTSVIECVNYL
jgi:hypothetical protein